MLQIISDSFHKSQLLEEAYQKKCFFTKLRCLRNGWLRVLERSLRIATNDEQQSSNY